MGLDQSSFAMKGSAVLDLTLDQIKILKSINDAGSISSAAEKIHRAKSAISYSIKKLEDHIGFELIDRDTYRGGLTPRGKQFLLKASYLLEAHENLKHEIHQIAAGVEARISLSATSLFSLKKFNKTILALQDSFPDTEVIFHRELLSGDKLLMQEFVDIALTEKPLPQENYESLQIDTIKMKLVISSKHKFLKLPRKDQTENRLLEFPQVIQRSTLPDENQYGVYRQSKWWTVSDLSSKRQIILDGLGWGRLPEHEIKEDLEAGLLQQLPQIAPDVEVPIYIGRRLVKDHGRVNEYAWQLFSSLPR